MKLAVASLFALFVAATAQAGSFGGPPPFTNGSPLPTGVDGSYQANVRGSNLSGVFRFTYSGGVQSTSPTLDLSNVLVDPYNDYVIFLNGIVYRGLVQANINGSKIAGVLDNGGAFIPNTDSSFSNILVFMNGYFNGKAQQNSPDFSFKGNGTTASFSIDPTTSTSSFEGYRDFKFNGIRAAIN